MDIKWPSRCTNPQCIRHWQDIANCTYIDPLKSSHSTHFLIHSCTLHSSFKFCLKINHKRHIHDTHIHTRPSPNTNLVHSQWQDIAICTYINPLESSHSTHFLIHDCTTLFLQILPQDQPLERETHTYIPFSAALRIGRFVATLHIWAGTDNASGGRRRADIPPCEVIFHKRKTGAPPQEWMKRLLLLLLLRRRIAHLPDNTH